MYPFLLEDIFGYALPIYDLFIILGVFLMLLYIGRRFEKEDGFTRPQSNRILLLIFISVLAALFFSWLMDGIFHSIQSGELEFGSLNFLSGLVGGFATFILLMKYFYKEPNKDMKRISNTVLTGVVLAHALGRVGCFFAGCCYGIVTKSWLGVEFTHGHAPDLHPGEAVLPTQLFEAFFLLLLFLAMHYLPKLKNKETEAYVIGYGIWRFGLEFLRGDDRGAFLNWAWFQTEQNTYPTPAQMISFVMVVSGIVYILVSRNKKLKQINQ